MDKNNDIFWSGNYQPVWTFILSIILLFLLPGCKFMKDNTQKDLSNSYYFSSPSISIQIISELLVEKKFKILAKYYDLSNSKIKLSELESGDFFIQKERPEVAHPAGFWRYKHPFAPGFTFSSARVTANDAIYIIEVSISIDQGMDFPKQIGYSHFYMIKSEKGWKILPDQVDEKVHDAEMPVTNP
jgi:hypothetical protein